MFTLRSILALSLLLGCTQGGELYSDRVFGVTTGEDAGPPPMGTDAGLPPAPPADAGGAELPPEPDAGAGCIPSCAGAECGDDGCGGSCGTCTTGTCEAGSCVAPPPAPGCPPTGARGPNEGDVAPNVTFTDCSGNPVSLDQALCGHELSWLISHTEWCGSCRSKMRQIEGWYDGVDQSRLGVLVAVTAMSDYGTPDQADCQAIRDAYGLEDVQVVIGTQSDFLNNFHRAGAWTGIVMSQGLRIEAKGQFSLASVSAALD